MSMTSTDLGDDEWRRGILSARWDGHDVFTVEQAGEILGLSRPSAYQAALRGEIPTIRLGRRLIVPRIALERMLEGALNARAS